MRCYGSFLFKEVKFDEFFTICSAKASETIHKLSEENKTLREENKNLKVKLKKEKAISKLAEDCVYDIEDALCPTIIHYG